MFYLATTRSCADHSRSWLICGYTRNWRTMLASLGLSRQVGRYSITNYNNTEEDQRVTQNQQITDLGPIFIIVFHAVTNKYLHYFLLNIEVHEHSCSRLSIINF